MSDLFASLAMAARKKRRGSGKVIHVEFGPNGGRVITPSPPPAETPAPPPTSGEPVSDVFSPAEVARLTGMAPARLRSLDKSGVVPPSGQIGKKRAYTFRDLIVLRMVQGLLAAEVKPRDVAAAVRALRHSLPKVTKPLAELRIVSDGKKVVVRAQDGAFEPVSGQMLLDFEVKDLREDVVRVLRPKTKDDRQRVAFELYVRASQRDEEPATMDEAAKLYERAIELDPTLAIAYTNLGNIKFRRGDEEGAVKLYRRALEVDREQPEAQYNLGYVLLDRGDPQAALPFFEGAVRADGQFADAHFYLAMTYESLGDRQKARPAWKRYLEIEPNGTWADIARRHL